VLGEVIVRPTHFVVESDIFRGHGPAGLLRAYHQEFMEAPDLQVLCDPAGKLDELQRQWRRQR
jgi:hypothetical protein